MTQPHPRRRTVAAALCLLVAGCGGTAEAPQATNCGAAVPYAGGPLHAPVPQGLLPLRPPTSATPIPDDLDARLTARVNTLLHDTGAPAIAAALHVDGFAPWSLTRGLARVDPAVAADESTLFPWASVGKATTAVVVLQLVEAGRLSLSDTLARWFPAMPNADAITVDHLLTHRSGLATHPHPEPTDRTTRDEWLASALATPAIACPGAVASYSNLGYDLLGRIVEAMEGEPFDTVVARRIAAPLGLQNLRGLREGEQQAAGAAIPHAGRVPAEDRGAWLRIGSGNIVATASDMLAFWRATLAARPVLASTLARQWSALYPIAEDTPNPVGTWFGQGVMLMAWSDPDGPDRTWLGHLGGTPHTTAVVAHEPARATTVAVAVNNGTSAAGVANSLLAVVAQWQRERPPSPDQGGGANASAEGAAY